MATVQLKYRKNPPQKLFHEDLTSPMMMMAGGYGSGKTYALCMKMIRLSLLNKNISGGLLSPDFPMYKKDVLPIMEEILEANGLKEYTKIHRTEHYIIFPWTKAKFYFFTAEKDIKGPNLGFMGVNEYSLIPLDKIQQMIARVRVKNCPYPQKAFAGTPEDIHGWLDEFVEKHTNSGLLRLINAKTSDNHANIDEAYIEMLRSTLDPLQFRLFAMGEMISLATNIFYYSFSKEKNDTDMELNDDLPLFINMDFNVGNMCATTCQKYLNDDGQKVSVFCDEIVIEHAAADTYAMVAAIKARYSASQRRGMMITCDFSGKARKTTGPSDVNVLREAFGVDAVRYAAKGNIRMRKRQILLNGLFAHRNILINSKKCPTLTRDVRKVTQKEDFSKDKNNPKLTHTSDTMDYYADQEYESGTSERFKDYKAL